MKKVLVSKKRIKEIAEFIDLSLGCDFCPIADKCWSIGDAKCKNMIVDYLMGDDEK